MAGRRYPLLGAGGSYTGRLSEMSEGEAPGAELKRPTWKGTWGCTTRTGGAGISGGKIEDCGTRDEG